MGISIYISKQAILDQGFRLTKVNSDGDVAVMDGPYARICRAGSDFPMAFEDIGTHICHVANNWGSSRKPIVNFLAAHGFLAGSDWYEA